MRVEAWTIEAAEGFAVGRCMAGVEFAVVCMPAGVGPGRSGLEVEERRLQGNRRRGRRRRLQEVGCRICHKTLPWFQSPLVLRADRAWQRVGVQAELRNQIH
jgi:hypothetical protein